MPVGEMDLARRMDRNLGGITRMIDWIAVIVPDVRIRAVDRPGLDNSRGGRDALAQIHTSVATNAHPKKRHEAFAAPSQNTVSGAGSYLVTIGSHCTRGQIESGHS